MVYSIGQTILHKYSDLTLMLNKMGFITESKEPIVYAEYINNLMEDQEKIKKIGLYNHQYAKKHFLASIVAKRLRIIYEKMLSD